MVVIELDQNIRIGSYGIAEVNGHHVAFGAMPDKYQAKCLSCQREFTKDNEYFRLSGLDAQLFQLYSFYPFVVDSCDSDHDSLEEVITDKVMMKHIGDPMTPDKEVSIEREIEELLGYGMSADVDIETAANATATLKSDKDLF
ncbi:hypothetical protein M199_gp054 [Halogranum tailed virus 1]|uniref:Uncharacterized protein n=1 Tax=Halogranum tailed virus 1 TaxID=1273749 RepID=R4T6S5_9CAUD|nr:hypothetical protein M199_gp054 [Halogranum tailed virus 1]AGM11384.1 hypothetical protein HGTV1_54 [Halogranum tailed virus 1]